jgi:hypothetical protein
LEKTDFLATLQEMSKEVTFVGVRGKKMRKLNMGHVISILRAFKESSRPWIVKIREESGIFFLGAWV